MIRRRMLALAIVSALGVTAASGAASPAAESLLVAATLRAEGDLEGALAELDRAVVAAPDEAILGLERARLLFDLGRLDEASAEIARARAGAPREIEALRLQGRIELARASEDPEAIGSAIEAFSELRQRDPSDVEVLVSLGQLYLAGGQAELAAEALNEAERLRPGNGWIESLRTRAVRGLEDGAAERLQREALDRSPGNLSARLELVERLSRSGRHAEALALLDTAPPGQRERSEVKERRARELHFTGETERALAIAESVLAERPQCGSCRRLVARIQIALGEFGEARAVLAPVESEASTDEAVAELLVRAQEAQGDIDGAVAVLEGRRESFERRGQSRLARAAELDLSRLLLRHDRAEEAVEIARSAAETQDPDLHAAALAMEVHALARAGRADEAFALAAEARPGSEALRLELLLELGRAEEAKVEARDLLAGRPELRLRVAAAFHDAEQWQEALELLESVLIDEPDSLEAAFRLAACAERLGRIDRAVELFRSVLERAPRFAAALNYLGYLWIERAENLEEALAMVTEAVRLDPDSGAYVDSLGWGLYRLGRFAEAVHTLERATRLLPRDATVHEHLGDARAAAGDRAGASESYRRAIELAPGSVEIERKLAELSGES